MSEHRARVDWRLNASAEDFRSGRYSREHDLHFDGGLTAPGTPSPQVVPAPWSSPAAIDPEAAFVAALSACHMLWFLDLARRQGFVVESYEDPAAGVLGRIDKGRIAVTRVTLRPRIAWLGEAPTPEQVGALHEQAHHLCFIANSVRTEVIVEAAEIAAEA